MSLIANGTWPRIISPWRQFASPIRMALVYPLDATEHLDSEEAIATYLVVLEAAVPIRSRLLGCIAKAHGMTEIACEAGIARTGFTKR